jgi:hypothetical protein
MSRRTIGPALVAGILAASLVAGAAGAAQPTRDGGRFTVTEFDVFIFELCGIETMTTWTQVWSVKDFADGSSIVHVTRRFVPEDPRLPIEKAGGTTFIAPDGTRTVVGTPIHLIARNGGTTILDAGLIVLGDEITVRGPHPSFDVDLADYYCP